MIAKSKIADHSRISDIPLVLLRPPEGMGRSQRWVQYWGNPWRKQSKLCTTFLVKKIRNNLFPQRKRNSCYTVKNSYFYLILAKRPWSDDATSSYSLKCYDPRKKLVVAQHKHVQHHTHSLCDEHTHMYIRSYTNVRYTTQRTTCTEHFIKMWKGLITYIVALITCINMNISIYVGTMNDVNGHTG